MAEKRVAQIAGHLFPKGMLADQVAIITGSGQGIGAEAANMFAKEGAKVVVQDIDASILPKRAVVVGSEKLTIYLLQPRQLQSRKLSMMLVDKQQPCQVTC